MPRSATASDRLAGKTQGPPRPRAAWLPLSLALLLAASGAAAQGAGPDTLNPLQLEPVVVTVLRTPFTLATVPYSVAVRDARQIQQGRQGLGLEEALRGIPGVQVDNRYNYALGERISIRGFGARAQFGVRGVKVLVDGIPATLPDGQSALSHIDFSSLGGAEVIRGPASALYGNTAGGVIQLTSIAPPATPFGQDVTVVGGADGMLRLNSSSGGRSGRSSYLLNLSHLNYDGYRERGSASNSYLNGLYTFQTERDELRLSMHAVDYDAQNPGSLSEALLRENRFQAAANNKTFKTGETGRQGQLGAFWRHSLPGGSLEVSAYGLKRTIDNPIPFTIVALERSAGGAHAIYRGEARPRLLGLQWSVGAELDRQRDDRQNYRNLLGARDTLFLNQLEHITSLGLFAQAAVQPTTRLGVLGGVRYDRTRFQARDRYITAANADDSGDRAMPAFSPSVGLTYALAEPLRLYANVATSFETPTTTELTNRPDGAGGFNPELEPQTAVSYELGARGRLGRRVAYQLAGYYMDVSNELISFEVPSAPGRSFFRNAGSAVHQGVEAGLTLAPLARVLAQLSYTYTDAAFDVYRPAGADYDGNAIPGVAPHRVDASLTYTTRAGWYLGAESRYVDRMAVNDANTAFSPAYGVTDVRTGWEEARIGRLRFSPFLGVTNLFDREYNTSVVINAAGNRFYEPGPSRSLYAGAKLRAGV